MNSNIFEDIANRIGEGIENSIVAFISGLILGILNPILTGIGLDPV